MTAIAIFGLFDNGIYNLDFLKQFLLLILVWIIIMAMINEGSVKVFTREIKIADLEPEMVLAETIYRDKKQKCKKEIRSMIRTITKPNRAYLIDSGPEGVTKEELTTIRKLYKENKLTFTRIRIHNTTPFAPFFFVGVLITLYINNNIISYLMTLL